MSEQPRVPAGDPKGGQWTRMGATESYADGTKFVTDESNMAARKEWEEKTGFSSAGSYGNPPPKVADLKHKRVKGSEYPERAGGLWGSSHSNSYEITGHSANQMGIEGYDDPSGTPLYQKGTKLFSVPQTKSLHAKHADFMLKKIAESPGSEETLFHGFQDLDATNWKIGDTFRLPLTATGGTPDVVGYGITRREVQKGPPTLFIFEKGTKMMPYAINPRSGEDGNVAEEFGHNYSEAIVAGGFKVLSVTKAPHPHNHAFVENGWPEVTIVRLQQTETFVPGEGWEKK